MYCVSRASGQRTLTKVVNFLFQFQQISILISTNFNIFPKLIHLHFPYVSKQIQVLRMNPCLSCPCSKICGCRLGPTQEVKEKNISNDGMGLFSTNICLHAMNGSQTSATRSQQKLIRNVKHFLGTQRLMAGDGLCKRGYLFFDVSAWIISYS